MPEYDIFLSHSSKDKCKVELIYDDLCKQDFKVWFDKENIRGGENWTQALEVGVDNSAVLLVIWTEEAKNSEWVQNELTRASSKKIPIIPLRFDDAEASITIQNIQHIDARSGYAAAFPELVSRISRFVESANSEKSNSQFSWDYQKQPFFRSRFLEENNYLNRNADNFATNLATKMLRGFNETIPERFVTLVCIPIPSTIDIQLHQSINFWRDYCSKKYSSDTPQWQRIQNYYFSTPTKTSDSVIFYENPRQSTKLETLSFIRFDRDGIVEFGNSVDFAFDYEDVKHNNETRQGFRLLPIIGATWKILYFAANYYHSFSYYGKFQFLVNFKNTKTCRLDGFADKWLSSYDRINLAYNRGAANDDNMQFIYDIPLNKIIENPIELEEVLIHLCKEIQWAFNLDEKLRYLHTETNEFDWKNYPRDFL